MKTRLRRTAGAGTPLRVLLVDDHAVVRHGLRVILEEAFPGLCCEEAGCAANAVGLVAEREWDLVILDISLPDRSGLDALKDIRAIRPALPVLVLSVHSADQFGVRVLRAGAAGYMTKDSAPQDLVRAVRETSAGERYITAPIANRLARDLALERSADGHETLSDREFQVLRALGAGRTVSQVAAELGLSVKTVSTYRARLLEKMDLRSNAEIAAYAAKHGLSE